MCAVIKIQQLKILTFVREIAPNAELAMIGM